MREVTIVTDGSCIGNPGPGAWDAFPVVGISNPN
jgi:ribonuclease HI